jgi:hypothetical protein
MTTAADLMPWTWGIHARGGQASTFDHLDVPLKVKSFFSSVMKEFKHIIFNGISVL